MTIYPRIISLVLLPTLAFLFSACGSGGGGNPSPPGAPESISIQISPDAPTIHTGETIQFTATVTGSDNLAVTWTVAEENAGAITAEGLYTAPNAPGIFHVVATSQDDPGQQEIATVTVVDLSLPPPISIRITPGAAQLATGQRLHLTATVVGSDATVVWEIEEGAAGGFLTPEEGGALYTAPEAEGTFHIFVFPEADPSVRAVATMTVITAPPPPPGIVAVQIIPETMAIGTGDTFRFEASVTGSADTAVVWTVQQGPLGGSVDAAGVYTAPDRPGSYDVIATSRADPSKSARTTVTVTAPIMVSLTPPAAAISIDQQQTFQAAVTGSDNRNVVWSIQEGAAGGTITPGAGGRATYTAPGAEGIFHVVATSQADPSRTATAAVTVTARPVISVLIQPETASLSFGEQQTFTAAVSGHSNRSVVWSIQEGPDGGTMTENGLYTAPNREGTIHVVAASSADPARRAIATVTVKASIPGRTVERISIGPSGTQGNGLSRRPFLGGGGRYVAFESTASNLVAGDANGVQDLFVRDREAGTTRRVSVDSSGQEGNEMSWGSKMSGDGRFIIFESQASNLVPDDTNGFTDIFLHDLQTGTTERVSVGEGGAQADSASGYAYVNRDGRYVVFYSFADNLVPGDTNAVGDVFIRDRQTGETTRLSVSDAGVQGNEISFCPSISDDGRYVSFISYSTNLVPGDTNGSPDIFVHDRQTGSTRRVSVDSRGVEGNLPSIDAKISGNGRIVAFYSEASNLVAGDTNRVGDLFAHDLQTGTTTRVSIRSNGAQGNRISYDARISRDGRFVAFDSDATNLVEGDTNGRGDIFVHDRQTGITTRPSTDRNGVEGNNGSHASRISGDGQFIAFDSEASNLVPRDTNRETDVFIASLP
ncbi:MAG: Ig-like domain-containing protein [Candidatus Manganitrophus sp. SA1]|nr:Ig-like domain-containing protein [Candidatus Manganitrophus morganii]